MSRVKKESIGGGLANFVFGAQLRNAHTRACSVRVTIDGRLPRRVLRYCLPPAVACRDENGLCFDTPNPEKTAPTFRSTTFFSFGGFPFFFS